MQLRLKGDDVAKAIRSWVMQELQGAPAIGHELGKYFFTTTTATIGVLATLAKINTTMTTISLNLALGLSLLFIAAVAGITLSIPFPARMDDDLFKVYEKTIQRLMIVSGLWLFFWVAGTVWTLLAIF
jgi:hypothetical protein